MVTIPATLSSANEGFGTHRRNTNSMRHKCDSIKLKVEKTTCIFGAFPVIGMITKNEKRSHFFVDPDCLGEIG